MKTPQFLKAPSWASMAEALLTRLIQKTPPEAETVTKAEVASEIEALWATMPLEGSVPPDELDAMIRDGDDVLAADRTGTALPDAHVDPTTAMMCARVAQSLQTVRRVAEMARPGALTVLRVPDPEDLAILDQIVRTALFHRTHKVSATVSPDPAETRVHCICIARPESSGDMTLKSATRKIEEALPLRHALIVVLSDTALLPPDLRAVLPDPTEIAPLSREAILFALTRTHSRTGRIDRKALLTILPPDRDLARLSRVQLARAFRETSTLRVARALARMADRPVAPDRLAELEGTGELHTVATQIVRDMAAHAEGTLPWADIPHGLLLIGAPGTGKTYAAKCIADASSLPLVATTIGEMQSKGHLGDMLRAMREVFDEARRKAPCYLFIDEIDSIGDRNSPDAHAKSYRRQVVNELLAQMDGLASGEGVMIIGATNHPDQIDSAVLRAGRLDLHVEVPMPGPAAIARLLRTELGPDSPIDPCSVGRAAAGKSPAEIVGAIRKAKAAARTAAQPLDTPHLMAALKRRVGDLGPLGWRIAVHEAGHAVFAHVAGIGEVLSIALHDGGGQILLDRHAHEGLIADYETQMAYALSGRAAELLILGTASAGAGGPAHSDLGIATRLALQIERSTGLGRNGLIWEPEDSRPISPTERENVQTRLEAQAERARAVLALHLDPITRIAHLLREQGFLQGSEVRRELEGNRSNELTGHTSCTRDIRADADRSASPPPPG